MKSLHILLSIIISSCLLSASTFCAAADDAKPAEHGWLYDALHRGNASAHAQAASAAAPAKPAAAPVAEQPKPAAAPIPAAAPAKPAPVVAQAKPAPVQKPSRSAAKPTSSKPWLDAAAMEIPPQPDVPALMPDTVPARPMPSAQTMNSPINPPVMQPAFAAPSGAPSSGQPSDAVWAPPAAPAVIQEQKLALVIGNGAYKTSPLTNPVNDAKAISTKLRNLGFTVITRENASQEEMVKSLREFGSRLKLGGVGLFYYAGHGIQLKGNNYLIPVNADIQSEDEVATRSISANEVLEKMDLAKNRVNIVILDACRNNPFTRSFRSAAVGLAAPPDAPSGTLIAYATSPGKVASDGSGANGLYTENLLKGLDQPGLKLEELFKLVRTGVNQASGGQQLPWELSSVMGDFYFNPTAGQASQPSVPPVAMLAPNLQGDLVPDAPARSPQMILLPRKTFEDYGLISTMAFTGELKKVEFAMKDSQFTALGKSNLALAWDAFSGTQIQSVAINNTLLLANNVNRAIAAGADNSLSIIDSATGNTLSKIVKIRGKISGAILSPDGKRLATTGGDTDGWGSESSVVLWDTATGKRLDSLTNFYSSTQVLFTADSKRLVTWSSGDSSAQLWNAENGRSISGMSAGGKPITLELTRDGSKVITVAPDESIRVFRTSDGDRLSYLSVRDRLTPAGLAASHDGHRLFAWFTSGDVYLFNLDTGTQISTWNNLHLRSAFFSQDGQKIFANGLDNNLRIFDVAIANSATTTLMGNRFVGFSQDERRFVTEDTEGARLFDARTLKPVARMPGQTRIFLGASARLLATAGADEVLKLWNLENGEPVASLNGHQDHINQVVFSADSRRLISYGGDQILLWGLPDVKDIGTLKKDTYETTKDFVNRVGKWSSPYSTRATLLAYDADAAAYSVQIGDITFMLPLPIDEAKKFDGQRQVQLSGTLKFFDNEKIELVAPKLERLQ